MSADNIAIYLTSLKEVKQPLVMVRSVCHLVLFTNSVYFRNFPGIRTSDSNQAKISTYQSHAVLLH